MSKIHRPRRIVYRPKRGGFNPLLVHGALAQIKPITNGIRLAEALGVKDRVDRALESNPVGRAFKSVGRFLQGALGYGSKRMPMRRSSVGRGRKRRVGRPRIHRGGSKTRHHKRRMGRGLTIV